MDTVDLRSVGLLSVLLFTTITLKITPAAGQAGSHTVTMSNLLDLDPRLDRPIAVTETGISLKTLLHQLSGQNLTLMALRSCEEQKLQIRLQHRSLRSLMSSIAEVFGGEWQPTADKAGYRFSETDATMLRRRRWWSLFLGEREQMLAETRVGLLQTMRGPQKPIVLDRVEDEQQEAINKVRMQRMQTMASASHDLFAQLPTALQEQLAQQTIADAFYDNSTLIGQSGYAVEGLLVVPMQDLPQSAQNAVMRVIAQNTAPGDPQQELSNVAYLRLRNNVIGLNATLLNAGARPVGSAGLSFDHPIDQGLALLLNQDPLTKAVQRLGRQASPTWRELAAYQNSTVWKNDPSGAFHPDYDPQPHRAEVLSWLASRGNFDFVADYYSLRCSQWSESDEQKPLRRPLKAELDFRAAQQDMSWKRRDDKILLFRDNRWYRDDNLEVPDDLLRKWIAQQAQIDRDKPQLAKGTPLPLAYVKRVLDLRAEVANTLTPWQIANGFRYAVTVTTLAGTEAIPMSANRPEGVAPPLVTRTPPLQQLPFGNLADLIVQDRNTLMLYAGLSDEQRLALLSGELAYSTLSEHEQESVRYLEPLISIALRQTGLFQTDQPVRIGLTPDAGEGHGNFGDRNMIWPNRTGIPGVTLIVTYPHLSSDQNVR
jgi:hypothetical protein